MRQSQLRFILQQGFEAADASESLYAALMVQPRIIGGLVARRCVVPQRVALPCVVRCSLVEHAGADAESVRRVRQPPR